MGQKNIKFNALSVGQAAQRLINPDQNRIGVIVTVLSTSAFVSLRFGSGEDLGLGGIQIVGSGGAVILTEELIGELIKSSIWFSTNAVGSISFTVVEILTA